MLSNWTSNPSWELLWYVFHLSRFLSIFPTWASTRYLTLLGSTVCRSFVPIAFRNVRENVSLTNTRQVWTEYVLLFYITGDNHVEPMDVDWLSAINGLMRRAPNFLFNAWITNCTSNSKTQCVLTGFMVFKTNDIKDITVSCSKSTLLLALGHFETACIIKRSLHPFWDKRGIITYLK